MTNKLETVASIIASQHCEIIHLREQRDRLMEDLNKMVMVKRGDEPYFVLEGWPPKIPIPESDSVNLTFTN